MSSMYVVVEWNQASGQPRIAYNGDLFDREEDAEDCAEQLREETRAVGRREQHTVHPIDIRRYE